MSDRETYAVELDEKICMLYGLAGRAWSEIGLLCLKFHEQHLYRHIGFQRFDDWAVNRFGKSRSTLREAMRAVALEFIAADFVDIWESASVDYEGLPRKHIRSLRRRSAEPAQFKTGIANARQNRNEAHQ